MSTELGATTTIQSGTKIGRFVVISELGRGGMGTVYAAHDPELDRQVALKIMREVRGDEEDRIRLLREGQAMARVTHPNVITVYEVGSEGGLVFLAQELLDGGTLGAWLEQPRTHDEILAKFIAAGRGLAAAHAAGLVHRDFKPDNVLLGKDGRVRVADFGLARALAHLSDALAATTNRGGGPPREDVPITRSPMSPLTRTGAVMGTPMFMAPEQHRGERADARSDQFGFCVALYHALYKDWPFPGKTAVAVADAVIEGRMQPVPKGKNVPAWLHAILVRGLRTEPEERFPSMDALLAELDRPQRPRRSRMPLIAGGVLVAAAAAAGGYAYLQTREPEPPARVAEPPERQPAPPPVEALTTDKGIAWLTTAIDRGQLGDAIDKYEMAAALHARSNAPADVAIAQAAGAVMLVLRGELAAAESQLEQASAGAAGNAIAIAYTQLAEAMVATARGKLEDARARSAQCAAGFADTAPVLAAMCHEIHGEALADLGDVAGARAAFAKGLAIAERHDSPERTSTLHLAQAQLDLDEQHYEQAAATASVAQAACRERNALGCEIQARLLLARVRLAEAETQKALELVESLKPAAIETFRVRSAHAIALGEILGDLDEAGEDGITGLTRLDMARAEAEKRGFVRYALEARLARTRVGLIHEHEDAAAEYARLVADARAGGFERIARLAEAYFTTLRAPEPTAGAAEPATDSAEPATDSAEPR